MHALILAVPGRHGVLRLTVTHSVAEGILFCKPFSAFPAVVATCGLPTAVIPFLAESPS